MEVRFRNRQLQRAYEQERTAIREYGPQVGPRYQERVNVILNAASLNDLFALPSLHLHPLTGDREGQYAMSLTGRMRLILTVEGATVTIEEVSAHYGD